MTYTQTRSCAECGHEMTRELSEKEAAFVELQQLKIKLKIGRGERI